MPGSKATLALGISFYAMGVIGVNVFFEPIQAAFYFHPAIELLVLSLGVFFLSSAFYGKLSSLLLLFSGAFLGGLFEANPVFVVLSLMPLLFAVLGGSSMGEAALLDLHGEKNFFENKGAYAAYAVLLIVLSLTIGFVFGAPISL